MFTACPMRLLGDDKIGREDEIGGHDAETEGEERGEQGKPRRHEAWNDLLV